MKPYGMWPCVVGWLLLQVPKDRVVVSLSSAVQNDCDPEDRGTTIGQQLTQRRSVTLRQPTVMLEAVVDVIRAAGVQAVQAQVVRGVLHQYGLAATVRRLMIGGSDA